MKNKAKTIGNTMNNQAKIIDKTMQRQATIMDNTLKYNHWQNNAETSHANSKHNGKQDKTMKTS